MKTAILATVLAALSFTALPVEARPTGGCPPGLAKKDPPCVPPGLAKKGVTVRDWHKGDRFDGRWEPVDWRHYELSRPRRDETWVRVGDVILRVNDETRVILDILRLTEAILSN